MTTLLPPDGTLFHDAVGGDADAMDTLLASHRSAVEAVCFRRLHSRIDAEDAVQETMVRGLRSLEHVEDPRRVGSYLCRIAERVCLDMLRAGARAMPMVLVDDTPDETQGPEALAIERERALLVHQTLRALSDRQATALWMRDALGESVPVVAEHLGVTEGSARVLLTRARAKMRDGWAKVAALLPGTGLKLPAFAVKAIHLGPLAVPAVVPAVALLAIIAASPMAMHALTDADAPDVRSGAGAALRKGPTTTSTPVPVVVRSVGTTTDAAGATQAMRTATPGSRSTTAQPVSGPHVDLGATTVGVGSRDTTRPDDDVTVGDDDLIEVGAEIQEVLGLLDDGGEASDVDLSEGQ